MNGDSYRLATAHGHGQNPKTPNEGDPAAKV
jgi:hypothetical protein